MAPRKIAFTLLLVIAACGCDAPLTSLDKRGAEDAAEFTYGVCLHGFPKPVKSVLTKAQPDSFRTDLTWSRIEQDNAFTWDRYDHLLKSGVALRMSPLWILCYGHPDHTDRSFPIDKAGRQAFARYAVEAASRYSSPKQMFEVWNEWNLPIGVPAGTPPGDPASYVALLAETYSAIKKVNPSSIVLGGAVAGAGQKGDWLKRACAAGLLDHLDGLSFHPYCYWMGSENGTPEIGLMELIRMLRATIRPFANGREIPLYVTEFGWPTSADEYGITPDKQAKFLARSSLLLRTQPDIKGAWWFTTIDAGGHRPQPINVERNFGLLYSDGAPKPALAAFQGVSNFFRSIQTLSIDPISMEPFVYVLRAEFHDGTSGVVLWTADLGSRWTATIEFTSEISSITRARLINDRQWVELDPISVEGGRDRIRVTFDDMPLIITGLPEEISTVSIAQQR